MPKEDIKMAVNWLWKSKVGEIVYKDERTQKYWKLQMFTGNMMCCFIYRFHKKNEETGKIEKFYNFFTWLNDLAHAKRILKDDKDFFKQMAIGKHKFVKVRIKANANVSPYTLTEMLRFGQLLAKYGYKVELY